MLLHRNYASVQEHQMMHDSTSTSIRLQSAVILLISFALITLGFGTMWARASLSLEGTIVQSDTVCDSSTHARCSTTYVISNGQGTITYIAGPNEQSLQRSLPVGTTIKKQPWHLVYVVNGVIVDDFGTGPAI